MLQLWRGGLFCALLFRCSVGVDDASGDALVFVQVSVHAHPTAWENIMERVRQNPDFEKDAEMELQGAGDHHVIADQEGPYWKTLLASARKKVYTSIKEAANRTFSRHALRLHYAVQQAQSGNSVTIAAEHACAETSSEGDCKVFFGDKAHIKGSYIASTDMDEGSTINIQGDFVVAPTPERPNSTGWGTNVKEEQTVVYALAQKFKEWKFGQGRVFPLNVTCPLCGGMCRLEIQKVKIGVAARPCPILAGQEVSFLDAQFTLPDAVARHLTIMKRDIALNANVSMRLANGTLMYKAAYNLATE